MEGQIRRINSENISTPKTGRREIYIDNKSVYNGGMERHDDKIILLLRTNPERGLTLLIERYGGYVYAVVKSKLGGFSKQDVEECASDIFYSIYQSRARIDVAKGTLKAFVCTVAKRKAIDRLRQLSAKCREYPEEGEPADAEGGAHRGALEKERRELLLRAVKALGEPDAQIVIRRYYFGQSHKEIALALHMNENTVCKRCARAAQKLGRVLEREDFIDE